MMRRFLFYSISLLAICNALDGLAQQKGQWVPGQYGLNAGVVPDPGFTYLNMAMNYSASQLNDSHGNHLPRLTGTYSFWVNENILMYLPNKKILGGYYVPYIDLNWANGSLVAAIQGTNLSSNGGGSGFADIFVVPANFGWHFSRADVNAGYGFFAPTGRYTPGASDNIGSGYWGNTILSGTTFYITQDKGTSANVFVDWETHGKKSGTDFTPGQAFTMEWGLGQVLPLSKGSVDKLLQVGFVGYDQWQVTSNGGTIGQIPASAIPYYSGHAVGAQANLILPPHGLNFFFKYHGEVSAKARPQGRTIVFGGSWTLPIPKPNTPNP
jgi:hypothetical protein